MNLKKFGKAWMYFCTVALTLLLLVLIGYGVFLWLATGKNRDFLMIDQCLDSGGTWEDEAKICIHAS